MVPAVALARTRTGHSVPSLVDGRDALDFPLDVAPHENIKDALVTFTNRTQDLSGRIQDAMGRPTADFTIVVFPTDTRYWLPRSRRIASTRPGTDGSFIGPRACRPATIG